MASARSSLTGIPGRSWPIVPPFNDMSFQYKNKCYGSIADLNSAVAVDCPVVSGNLIGVTCTPTASDVTVSAWSAGINIIQAVVPAQVPCVVPDLATPAELAWLVGGVWILAWGIRKVAQLLPGAR